MTPTLAIWRVSMHQAAYYSRHACVAGKARAGDLEVGLTDSLTHPELCKSVCDSVNVVQEIRKGPLNARDAIHHRKLVPETNCCCWHARRVGLSSQRNKYLMVVAVVSVRWWSVQEAIALACLAGKQW
jgi:hypothetical protein